jgi:hypothetical protein
MGWSGFRRASARGPWLVLVLLLASGCAKEEMPKTYAVKGKVVYKNGKPFPGGDIVFISVRDPELRAYGAIAKDGTFTLMGTIAHTSKGRSQNLAGSVEGECHVNIRPGRGGAPDAPPVGGGKAAFTLKKTYTVEAKPENDMTIVVE